MDAIHRDGFVSRNGHFRVDVNRPMDRIEDTQLRSMFLPKLTREGQKALRDNSDFARQQLKHYGVEFEEREFKGNGTALLKAALQAGKCDQVPDHIAALETQMHAEWLDTLRPEDLTSSPEWAMEKYFLSAGKPDRKKTTTPVGIPFDRSSEYRPGLLIEAAGKVPGLHCERVYAYGKQYIFMGWNEAAVKKASKEVPAEKAKRLQDEEDERERELEKLHADTRRQSQVTKNVSPVGAYDVKCEEIKRNWPQLAQSLTIDIHETDTPGVFKGEFDFGILEGVMFLCADQSMPDEYCARADGEDESDWDDSADEEESEPETDDEVENKGNSKLGTKRKARASKATKPKKAKTGGGQSRKYHLKLKCRETSEGMIHHQASDGVIEFKEKTLVSLKGEASLPSVGVDAVFHARKVCDVPDSSGMNWSDFSERNYERARINRWH